MRAAYSVCNVQFVCMSVLTAAVVAARGNEEWFEQKGKNVLEMVLIMAVLWQEVARKMQSSSAKSNVENALNVVMLLFLGRFLWPKIGCWLDSMLVRCCSLLLLLFELPLSSQYYGLDEDSNTHTHTPSLPCLIQHKTWCIRSYFPWSPRTHRTMKKNELFRNKAVYGVSVGVAFLAKTGEAGQMDAHQYKQRDDVRCATLHNANQMSSKYTMYW